MAGKNRTPAERAETCSRILDIIFEYSLQKFQDTQARLALGRPKFLSVIDRFVDAGETLRMCLPAFPFKSANQTYKVLGTLPDKAEELALERLDTICQRIRSIYPPGAQLTIISDGLVYNDLLGIPDRDTWAYGQVLRALAVQKKFEHISFSRLRDLVNFPGPEQLNEITYVANATNFRRCLLNQYGRDDIDIEDKINTDSDTMLTYLGYRRFLVSDLQYMYPLSKHRSKNAYKKDIKYLAQQMLIRGYAFAGAVKAAYPNHLRLSIHQSTGEHKISLSLLNTTTGFTTPWHCSVALMSTGEWLSAPKGDFENDPRLRVVYHQGRPSHFEEKEAEKTDQDVWDISEHRDHVLNMANDTSVCAGDATSKRLQGPASEANSELSLQEEAFANVKHLQSHPVCSDSNGVSHVLASKSPQSPHQHPALESRYDDPSVRCWLETLASRTQKGLEQGPNSPTGTAYRDLLTRTFSWPVDCQRAYGKEKCLVAQGFRVGGQT